MPRAEQPGHPRTRGTEQISDPYLALLGILTPQDLRPYVGRQSKFWRDGFFARFAFVAPSPGSVPSTAPFPDEPFNIPDDLAQPLINWHHEMGESLAEIEEKTSASGQFLGYRVERTPIKLLPCMLEDVPLRAYYAYNNALMEMVKQVSITWNNSQATTDVWRRRR
ncbi:MAG TPA: DUF3987 domain-containing protein [Ktedonobacteraceae bacterium]|nr:DUF3987 domain-containing protein [Ktedonobacteraceae bacterium]